MTSNLIKIDAECQGQRLDKFLTEYWPDLSRSQIKKMILQDEVLVNGEKTTVHRFLKENDKIEIRNQKLEIIKKNKNQKSISNFQLPVSGLFKKIKVIADSDDFIILEKPAGLLVHPTDKNETDTLVDWLIASYPEIAKIGEDPARPGIVHRLDKDVSGLMVIPRNQDSFDYFKSIFKSREIQKKYTALVYGEMEKTEDTIDLPIGRSKTKPGLYAAHPKAQGEKFADKDKLAVTEISVVKKFKNFTLLSVKILTGRTHQIRVHLTAYGHPIVGDNLYLNKKLKTKKELSRIFLHADYLAFTAPDGKEYEFHSKLPSKLADYLKALKPIK